MSSPKVSIVILNWNGWKDTVECIESLAKIDYPNYEIIVVDNGSTDESVIKLKMLQMRAEKAVNKNFKIIENKENLGFSGGNNVGIRFALKSNADYILLLNNDTLVKPNFLSELVKIGESSSKIGLIGPKIYFAVEPNRIWFGGGKINWLKTKGEHLNYNKTDDKKTSLQPSTYQVSDYLTGCCLLIKRAAVEKIGMLSEDYFLYYEDTDYCLRAQGAGWQCVYIPSAYIWHKISQSTREFSPSYIYYHSRNGLMLAKKHNPAEKVILVYLFSIYLVIKQLIKYLFLPQKRLWVKMALLGIYDFYRNRAGKFYYKGANV